VTTTTVADTFATVTTLGKPDTTVTPSGAPAQLPFTGGDPQVRLLIGLVMVVAGGALLGLSRRARAIG
jgi:hypothetical protein